MHSSPSIHRRKLLALAAAASLAGLGAQPALAADKYPSKPVTLIVPYAAGGSTDVVARLYAQKLTERLGQSFVVDNRPGANAVIGMDAASRAAPDGYTLLLNTAGGQTLAPIIYKTKFDGLSSWEPIGLMSTIPFVIVARDGFPAKNWAEFVKVAQAGSPPVSASSGSSLIVLMTDALKGIIGAPTMINAQYKGTSLQAQAVVKGEVDVSIDSMVTLPHIKSGRVKALAVVAPKRVDSLPDVPTLTELGVKGMEFSSWSALLAPKGTPAPIVAKLSKELQEISKMPDVQERLKGFDHTPVIGSTPEQLTKQITDDMARWRKVVKETGFQIQQ